MKCGVDIVQISRIARALGESSQGTATGERFKQKVFTPREIAYCEARSPSSSPSGSPSYGATAPTQEAPAASAATESAASAPAPRRLGALQSYAARFAAKEAFAKALGTGLGSDVSLCEIEVENDPASSKPSIRLSGKTLDLFAAQGFSQIELSLSHEADYAVAFVIIQ